MDGTIFHEWPKKIKKIVMYIRDAHRYAEKGHAKAKVVININ